ncbi:MAG: DNA adenine methylase [Lachnospiraceae bacterium]|nr:DNA adenine methylase [Lachnospiraceae bacterium]
MKYMGSKARIASHISQYINDIAFIKGITEYYEPFMGGCSVGELVRIPNRHLSDINKHMVALMKKVQDGMWDYKYITREEWYKIKDDRYENKIYPAWLTGWCSVACSFRGRCFEGYAGEYPDSISGKMVNPQLQVYNSLCKERPSLLGIDFQHRKYNEIGKPHHAVIYCDAPYRGTKQYTMVESFDFDAYDEWLIEMSKDNLVLISEYSMIGKHTKEFVQLDEWQLNKSIGAGQTDDESSIERLYYVKGGWLTEEFLSKDSEDFDF